MERKFTLMPICFELYNCLCRDVGTPIVSLERKGSSMKFFGILNRVAFENIGDIVREAENGVQTLGCIWIPGKMLIGEARKLTQKPRILKKHLEYLKNKGEKLERFIVEY
jgi:hypothetical protein